MNSELVDAYLAGVESLRRAVREIPNERLAERPVSGAWSALEVLCHLADSEAVFADRMKRILAEDRPLLPIEFIHAKRRAMHLPADRDPSEWTSEKGR